MAELPDALAGGPAGKDQVPKEVMAEHQRDRVLRAAIEVFAERGYPGTTVDHIVSAAKVGVGNFYNLCGGKEECFLQAYDRAVEDARAQIAAAIDPEAAWPEQARQALAAVLSAIDAEPKRARLVLVEIQTVGAKGVARHEQTLRTIAALLRRGRDLNPTPGELPDRLEEAVAGGLAWFLHQQLSGEKRSLSERLSDAMEIVVAPYIGREDALSLAVSG